ncbi:hypothetical protein L249_6783 [Ophiocordyceps polyrhachis-furcata BCC 54312]|uniref:Uncharacterized protein n=1 Tax=Ophiocordyceps polyrhachis-furcata BCC 54312 TaxID=1330021 RepID=A0A367LJQ1_9HYPO|nr:hypothetical protein L249_6783 [Ophiocordyceps polyrhachis-furcata BCC 54312]
MTISHVSSIPLSFRLLPFISSSSVVIPIPGDAGLAPSDRGVIERKTGPEPLFFLEKRGLSCCVLDTDPYRSMFIRLEV